MERNNSNSGCGCIIVLIIIVVLIIVKCNDSDSKPSKKDKPTMVSNYQNDTNHQSPQTVDYLDTNILSKEDSMYLHNSLTTGAKPYSQYYGNNFKCKKTQCSGIEVTAPVSSDIIVIIKRNDQYGEVISHGYIRKGQTYTFDLPNGTFQPFFYYGMGWNPQKDMGNGIVGGFVIDELFSKDEPQDISNCVLSYVLQLSKNGNFQTESSNKTETF